MSNYSNYKNMICSIGPSTKMAGEDKNCAVLALSAAFEIPYDKADEFATTEWNRKRKKGTNTHAIINSMTKFKELFGKRIAVMPVVNNYTTPKKTVVCKSKLYTFAQRNNKGTYYVLINKHALVVKDGQILDGSKPGSTVKYAWKVS